MSLLLAVFRCLWVSCGWKNVRLSGTLILHLQHTGAQDLQQRTFPVQRLYGNVRAGTKKPYRMGRAVGLRWASRSLHSPDSRAGHQGNFMAIACNLLGLLAGGLELLAVRVLVCSVRCDLDRAC